MREVRPNAIVAILCLTAIAVLILFKAPQETEALMVAIGGIAWCARELSSKNGNPKEPPDEGGSPFPFRGRR